MDLLHLRGAVIADADRGSQIQVHGFLEAIRQSALWPDGQREMDLRPVTICISEPACCTARFCTRPPVCHDMPAVKHHQAQMGLALQPSAYQDLPVAQHLCAHDPSMKRRLPNAQQLSAHDHLCVRTCLQQSTIEHVDLSRVTFCIS